jgi:ribosomal protein S18 acetylase RimI-like enzyme
MGISVQQIYALSDRLERLMKGSAPNRDTALVGIDELLSRDDAWVFTADRNGQILAVGALELLRWDTSLFGAGVARIAPFVIGPRSDSAALEMLVRELLECAQEANIQHVRCRVTAEQLPLVWALQRAGLMPVDVGVTLSLELNRLTDPDLRAGHPIRPVRPDDMESLHSLAKGIFRGTWFYNDPFFGEDRADLVYARWIDSACADQSRGVLVAEIQGRIVGFITQSTRNEHTGRIGLVAVAPEYARLGIGRDLVAHALRLFPRKGFSVVVRTPATFYAAIAFYVHLGFEVAQTDLTLTRSLQA